MTMKQLPVRLSDVGLDLKGRQLSSKQKESSERFAFDFSKQYYDVRKLEFSCELRPNLQLVECFASGGNLRLA